MPSRMEKLMFSVGLIDQTAGGANSVTARVDDISSRATKGMQQVGVGAAGLFATGYALKAMLGPSIEMARALREVESLGVNASALAKLESTALKTSMAYGISATDIVRSSYDIQSAIGGLTDNELSTFTKSSAILAKATKADASTITDYMGTMYGIFQTSADSMGKAQWVEQLAGQTAKAVELFKTDGSKMAQAFKSLGADATAAGIAQSEQIAVLGTLSATMEAGVAGSKYRAFLGGVGKAQKSLGLDFVDSQGKMLPMLSILDKLKGKYGDTIDVAEQQELTKAFGGKEAAGLISALIGKTDGLATNIGKLSDINNMDNTIKMAKTMVDPWQQFQAMLFGLTAVFGKVLAPAIVPVIDKISQGGAVVMRWTELFPNLTKVVGMGVLGVLGLVAAVSAFSIMSGIASLAMAGWGIVTLAGTGIMKAWRFSMIAAHTIMALTRVAIIAGSIAMGLLKMGLISTLAPMWAFTAALLANPVVLITLGILALGVAIVGLVVYWDEITAAVGRFADGALAKFKLIPAWFAGFKDYLSTLNPFSMLGDGIDFLIEKINLIPGIDIDTRIGAVDLDRGALGIDSDVTGAGLGVTNTVPTGGIAQQLTNNNNAGPSIGDVNVYSQGQANGFDIHDQMLMAAGA